MSNYIRQRHNELAAAKFLERVDLPSLSADQLAQLNRPIELEAVEATISSLPSGKAPGRDGYTTNFYKTMKERLSQLLEEVYSAIWKGEANLSTGQENYVRVIYKQDRDPRFQALIDLYHSMWTQKSCHRL